MTRWLATLLVAGALLLAPPSEAKRRRRRARPAPSPTATPTPRPYQGPPVPPLFRAAGSVLKYEPGRYLMVAEVGQTGRVFRLDEKTELDVVPKAGTRIRILYLDDSDGPLARKVMPGPVETGTPPPGPP